jgi:hypothetical protein
MIKKCVLAVMQSAHYPFPILIKLDFSLYDSFYKNTLISNFMQFRPMGAELFHADGLTDRHDDIDSRFSQLCESS